MAVASDTILRDQPAVESILVLREFPEDMVLKAAKVLQSQQKLSARELLLTLEEWVTKGIQVHSVKPTSPTKQSRHFERLGSTGEEVSSIDDNDIETDGCEVMGTDETDAAPLAQKLDAVPKLVKAEPRRLDPDPEVKNPEKNHVQSLKKRLKVLKSENRRLKERALCRNCHSKPVSITFLPCGHYSFCYDCGQTFSACPICKKTILADVRTFLA